MSKLSPAVIKTIDSALSFKITTPVELTEAATLLATIEKESKRIQTEKEKVTKPLNEALKAERARWKPIEEKLDTASSTLRSFMSEYQTRIAREASEQASKLAARIGEGKGKLKVETAATKLATIESNVTATKKTVTEAGTVSFRTVEKLDITDPLLIPRKYLMIDTEMVRRTLKAGLEVPGARLIQVQEVNVR